MALEIREVKNRNDLRQFIQFPFSLYANSPHWVPPLIRDEIDLFNPRKNPSLVECVTKQWLASKNGNLVGRIAGIIHKNESKSQSLARFGWLDFIDDEKVAAELLNTVESWAIEAGLSGMHGPLGFSDMDPEGMLVEGFETPATIATIYNFDYYPKYLESLGFQKAVDWIEARGKIPTEPSKRLIRTAEIVESRFKIRSLRLKSRKHASSTRGKEMFEILNKSYANLYGFHSLTDEQIDYYVKQYLGFIIPDLMSMIINEKDELVGFAVAMPSLTQAFQKARGKLFPFGFYHILRALKKSKTADLYLIGVLPKYQKMGVTSLIFRDLIRAFNRRGITQAITNQMLEENQQILTQFNDYQKDAEMHKRRRCYIKKF
ncbi:MAG: GNAT family N-acetyltransferase [Cytophagales bacterium]|nr:GNAT family N-acetyltransferase [Cytophagales bacterium]